MTIVKPGHRKASTPAAMEAHFVHAGEGEN